MASVPNDIKAFEGRDLYECSAEFEGVVQRHGYSLNLMELEIASPSIMPDGLRIDALIIGGKIVKITRG